MHQIHASNLSKCTHRLLNDLHLQNDITLQHSYKNYLASNILTLTYGYHSTSIMMLEVALAYQRLDDAGDKT